MQSTKDKQVTDVLYAELTTPKAIRWEYKANESAEWTETDSATLLFCIIPSGNLVAYRQKF